MNRNIVWLRDTEVILQGFSELDDDYAVFSFLPSGIVIYPNIRKPIKRFYYEVDVKNGKITDQGLIDNLKNRWTEEEHVFIRTENEYGISYIEMIPHGNFSK